jgi:hypothetical protein
MIRLMRAHMQTPRQADRGTARPRVQRSADEPQDDLLDLQRRFGNTAVTELVQRAPRDRPASTDIADVAGGAKHRGHPAEPPAKQPTADIHARVIKIDIDEGGTRITIASGPDQGVQVGMSGSLVTSKGREVADFAIESAEGRVSIAHLQATFDQVRADPQVVIKASSFAGESQAGKEF